MKFVSPLPAAMLINFRGWFLSHNSSNEQAKSSIKLIMNCRYGVHDLHSSKIRFLTMSPSDFSFAALSDSQCSVLHWSRITYNTSVRTYVAYDSDSCLLCSISTYLYVIRDSTHQKHSISHYLVVCYCHGLTTRSFPPVRTLSSRSFRSYCIPHPTLSTTTPCRTSTELRSFVFSFKLLRGTCDASFSIS